MANHLTVGVFESSPSLIYAVVIGQIEMGEAMGVKVIEPRGLRTEDEALEGWCMHLSGRTLEITNNEVGGLQHGIDSGRKEAVRATGFDALTHASV